MSSIKPKPNEELSTSGATLTNPTGSNVDDEGALDVRTQTVIEGASSNDPRVLGPTQLETSNGGEVKRNSFACVSCHSLKQKCVPSDVNDIYRKPCKRCLRNYKLCKFDLSKRTRKRRRRDTTDSPVLIPPSSKYLISPALQEHQTLPLGTSRNLPNVWPGLAPSTNESAIVTRLDTSNLSASSSPFYSESRAYVDRADDKTNENRNGDYGKPSSTSPLSHIKPIFKQQLHSLSVYQKDKVGEISSKLDSWANQWNELVEEGVARDKPTDPISQNLISLEEAELRFELWKAEFLSKFNFEPSSSMSLTGLRREKPILLSVIMSSVSVVMTSKDTTRETNLQLEKYVLNLITDHIFKLNHKSVELIESLLTLCLWYNFPEWSNKTRYHIFNYVCVCLIKDLGPTSVSRAFGMFSDEDPSKRLPQRKTPLEKYENGSRLILLVYISSLNISIFLRQPIQARWSSLTENACEDVLKRAEKNERLHHPDDDKTLVVFARLNFILEKIHIYLHEMKEQREYAEISDDHFKHLVEKFQSQLTSIFMQLPKDRHREMSFFYSVEAYLYQYIIKNYVVSQRRNSGSEALPLDVSDAFQKCYNYCVLALKEFLKMTPKLVASLPLIHMSRIIYTVGLVLFKLRYSVIVVPAFLQFKMLTENAISLVNEVAEMLQECSKVYEFNNFLYKFRYVVALFAQTYANKVGEFINTNTKGSYDQAQASGNNTSSRPVAANVGELLEPSSSPKPEANNPSNGIDLYQEALPSVQNNTFATPGGAHTSPSASDTINDYLTDVNSLMWGFNVLNDEFWTDVFTNDL